MIPDQIKLFICVGCVPSCVRARFRDSADDIDFYQMSLSQLESTIFHERIIFFLKKRFEKIYIMFRYTPFENPNCRLDIALCINKGECTVKKFWGFRNGIISTDFSITQKE